MEYLQYTDEYKIKVGDTLVLNLIINGIPSIPQLSLWKNSRVLVSFKPYYKWNTFNTKSWCHILIPPYTVLNLIINGIPSIL